jgi:hypothetical protein
MPVRLQKGYFRDINDSKLKLFKCIFNPHEGNVIIRPWLTRETFIQFLDYYKIGILQDNKNKLHWFYKNQNNDVISTLYPIKITIVKGKKYYRILYQGNSNFHLMYKKQNVLGF